MLTGPAPRPCPSLNQRSTCSACFLICETDKPPASQVLGEGADSVRRADRPMADPESGEEKGGAAKVWAATAQPNKTKHKNTVREVREQGG